MPVPLSKEGLRGQLKVTCCDGLRSSAPGPVDMLHVGVAAYQHTNQDRLLMIANDGIESKSPYLKYLRLYMTTSSSESPTKGSDESIGRCLCILLELLSFCETTRQGRVGASHADQVMAVRSSLPPLPKSVLSMRLHTSEAGVTKGTAASLSICRGEPGRGAVEAFDRGIANSLVSLANRVFLPVCLSSFYSGHPFGQGGIGLCSIHTVRSVCPLHHPLSV